MIDLRPRLPDADISEDTRPSPCVLATMTGGVTGLVVDEVLRIETVPEDQITAPNDVSRLPLVHTLRLGGEQASVLALDRLLG
jgi:chemotaxis signal transduction protein